MLSQRNVKIAHVTRGLWEGPAAGFAAAPSAVCTVRERRPGLAASARRLVAAASSWGRAGAAGRGRVGAEPVFPPTRDVSSQGAQPCAPAALRKVRPGLCPPAAPP